MSGKLQFHTPEEEPLMAEAVQAISILLTKAQDAGLSLSGGMNVLCHVMTMVLVSAYDDPKVRGRVAADIPDIIKAYEPQWEQIAFNQTDGERGKNHLAEDQS